MPWNRPPFGMAKIDISQFGESLGPHSGIIELMDDLGKAMTQEDMRMMGGGNPALIPAVVDTFREQMRAIVDSEDFGRMVGVYDPPQGNARVLDALAQLLRDRFQWEIGPENLTVTGGGQTAFFLLFNLLAGEHRTGTGRRRILFPLAPEYIGYANQGLTPNMFTAVPPLVEYDDDGFFKYRIDFDRLVIDDSIAAMCVSRPTNPTGNVLTDDEMQRLADLAAAHDIPLIIDNAYGAPFPNIIFEEVTPMWNPHTILTLSLSKLGLPGTRTAFVAGPPEIIQAITSANCVVTLANNNVGQYLVRNLFEDQSILKLCEDHIRPHYRSRAEQAVTWVRDAFGDTPVEIHRPEGALFLWLRFPNLPITSSQLYERLKARSVLIVPGHYFFFGLVEPHAHEHECIRMTYSQDPVVVQEGIAIMADEVQAVYANM
ncbi:MAG: valine--pyruvate aminotransferase [Verrucomicrobiales bacterium]|jgi:valine--pyruvate aminotransferase